LILGVDLFLIFTRIWVIRIAFTIENAARINLIFRLANLLVVSLPSEHISWQGDAEPYLLWSVVYFGELRISKEPFVKY